MIFEPGVYQHVEKEFSVVITERGDIYLSPNAPLSMRLTDIFNTAKWQRVEDKIE